MSLNGKPQDRKPSAQEMLNSALRMQSANMAQKATLDVMGGKLILILSALKKAEHSERNSTDVNREVVAEIRSITSMTRTDIAERRASGMFQYPDVAIQAVINKAVDEIAALLMPKEHGE